MRRGILFPLVILSAEIILRSAPAVQSVTSRTVGQFNAEGSTLFDAVLLLGQEQHIPLGIEYIDEEALQRPITVKVGAATVGQVLGAILKQEPGYSWSVNAGVIDVSHSGVPAGSANLLNRILPDYSIPSLSITEAGVMLDRDLYDSLHPGSQGFAGSYAGDILPLRVGPLSMRNVTVRQALNRIVGQAKDAAWVVQVKPTGLRGLPSYGLWKIVQYQSPPKSYSPMFLGFLRYLDPAPPNPPSQNRR